MKTNDIVYGVHAVTEALLANTGNKLYLQDDLRGKNVEKVKELAAEKKVSISWTSKKSLSEMTEGAVHQGFVLRVSEFAYSELDHILAKTRQEENPLLLILDGLTDPHNLGSILRTSTIIEDLPQVMDRYGIDTLENLRKHVRENLL